MSVLSKILQNQLVQFFGSLGLWPGIVCSKSTWKATVSANPPNEVHKNGMEYVNETTQTTKKHHNQRLNFFNCKNHI